MERYSTLGASIAIQRGRTGRNLLSFLNGVLLNPVATFFYNYILRAGVSGWTRRVCCCTCTTPRT